MNVVDKKAKERDRRLAGFAKCCDVIVQVTPMNMREAFSDFRQANFRQEPNFRYPKVPFDPSIAMRKLRSIASVNVEDEHLEALFQEAEEDLRHRLRLLAARGTETFVAVSCAVYGSVDETLLRLADQLLEVLPAKDFEGEKEIGAHQLAELAANELLFYEEYYPTRLLTDAKTRILVDSDVPGLMVSEGCLYIPSDLQLTRKEAETLIQHEVGTHVLTYLNGNEQPFVLFAEGLAGYDELQEGLAVLAEYFVGGLTSLRIRQLAARVRAVESMLQGESFVQTFERLFHGYGFTDHEAFWIAARVHRGGGLTKDAIYLRGLVRLLEYLNQGQPIEPLYCGKFGFRDVPHVMALHQKGMVDPPLLLPRYLKHKHKVKALQQGIHIADMVHLV